jgi:hypothetical protein
MAVYVYKTRRRARPRTRKLMEQINTLDQALRGLKKMVPVVEQLEADFDFDLLDATTKDEKFKDLVGMRPVIELRNGKVGPGMSGWPVCDECSQPVQSKI